jgi:hypothetical protein
MRYLHIAIQVLISITSALGAYLVPTPRQTPSTDRLTATPTLTSTPMPTTLVPRASPKSICKCATFGSEYLPCHDGHKCAFSQKSDCDMYGAYYIFDTVNGHTSRATRTVFPTTAFDKDCDGTKGLPTAVCWYVHATCSSKAVEDLMVHTAMIRRTRTSRNTSSHSQASSLRRTGSVYHRRLAETRVDGLL